MSHLPFSPCGACQALVDSDYGCAHWKPMKALKDTMADRRKREDRHQKSKRKKPEKLL